MERMRKAMCVAMLFGACAPVAVLAADTGAKPAAKRRVVTLQPVLPGLRKSGFVVTRIDGHVLHLEPSGCVQTPETNLQTRAARLIATQALGADPMPWCFEIQDHC